MADTTAAADDDWGCDVGDPDPQHVPQAWIDWLDRQRSVEHPSWQPQWWVDPLTGPAEDANRLQAVRDVASRRHLYTELRHYADAVDQALDGPTTQGEDA